MSLDILPFSTADYIADTQHLSVAQHGAYLLILIAMWRAGGWIPDDNKQLARITKTQTLIWKRLSKPVRALLMERDGKLSQKRLLEEYEVALAAHQKRVLAGSLGGRAKSLKTQQVDPSNATFLLESGESDLLEEVTSKEVKIVGQPRKGRQRSPRAPMREDWSPTDEGYQYAFTRGFDRTHTEQMIRACRNYHLKHGTLIAGEIGLAATWRTWCDNEIKFSAGRKGQQNGSSVIAAGRKLLAGLGQCAEAGGVATPTRRGSGAGDKEIDIDVRLLPER